MAPSRCAALLCLPLATLACGTPPDRDTHDARRARLVAALARQGIRDSAVLRAIGRVPRHRLVPAEWQEHAYDDRPLPIGHEQTISQPFVVAFMTECLRLDPTDRVLEVGTGSGYQAAVLAEIVAEVCTIEIVEPLGREAAARLAELGYHNIETRIGDGYRGWPERAPFDAIIVTAAPERVPEPLLDQLRIGGRLVLPLGAGDQRLSRLTKTAQGVVLERLLDVRFVPMTGEVQRRR